MKISPATILAGLAQFPDIKRYLIAYSGGLDSHVLLHALLHDRDLLQGAVIEAVHVNHSLSPNAKQWTSHCEQQCANLGVSLHQLTVDAQAQNGESPEAAARNVRYQAFTELMKLGDCLLTAHHQDDQAETLLLQLLRGAGPKGLAAMPQSAEFATGWHARPLLNVSRDELQQYANQHTLKWIDDESNFDTGFDRNFLRHDILPLLKTRFPAAADTLSRSASLCAEAAELLTASAMMDIDALKLGENTLSVSCVSALGETRARNVLHQWIHAGGFPVPSAAQMQRLWQDVMCSAEDSCPLVSWPGAEVRRYRDAMFIDKPLVKFDTTQVFSWQPETELNIDGLGCLSAASVTGQGISSEYISEKSIEVRFRQGGESLRLPGREGSHTLKNLFQEAGIPPWQRERIPLLLVNDELAAVTGYWVADEFSAGPEQKGLLPVWSPIAC